MKISFVSIRGLSAAVLSASFWLATVWSFPAQAQDACLNDPVLRCWHLSGVYGGDPPSRVVNLVRRMDQKDVASPVRRIEMLQVIELPSHPERYALWKMQVDCGKQLFLVETTHIGKADGTATLEPNAASGWTPLAEGRYGEGNAALIACPSLPGISTVQYNTLLRKSVITDAYRPADAADWVAKSMWGNLTGGR